MKFHPSECKVLSVSNPSSHSPFIDILPCVKYFYAIGDYVLDYTDLEKDLGIFMNSTFEI